MEKIMANKDFQKPSELVISESPCGMHMNNPRFSLSTPHSLRSASPPMLPSPFSPAIGMGRTGTPLGMDHRMSPRDNGPYGMHHTHMGYSPSGLGYTSSTPPNGDMEVVQASSLLVNLGLPGCPPRFAPQFHHNNSSGNLSAHNEPNERIHTPSSSTAATAGSLNDLTCVSPRKNRAQQAKKIISRAELEERFDRPLQDVAKEYGICITLLKKICRAHNIRKWPHRQIRSINAAIGVLENSRNSEGCASERQRLDRRIINLRKLKSDIIRDPSGKHGSLKRNALMGRSEGRLPRGQSCPNFADSPANSGVHQGYDSSSSSESMETSRSQSESSVGITADMARSINEMHQEIQKQTQLQEMSAWNNTNASALKSLSNSDYRDRMASFRSNLMLPEIVPAAGPGPVSSFSNSPFNALNRPDFTLVSSPASGSGGTILPSLRHRFGGLAVVSPMATPSSSYASACSTSSAISTTPRHASISSILS